MEIIGKRVILGHGNVSIGTIQNNLNKEEKLALKEMKSWDDKVIRVQDKGLRFVVLDTNNYIEKVNIK